MSLTFGATTAPNNITTYLDAVFATSLANYRKQLVDNIGATNALFHKLMKSASYESADGGTYIAEDLMYGLGSIDSYDGYDELGSLPTDGITQVQFEWRQLAAPIVYNMKEVIQNQHRLVDLVKSKIQQMDMGFQEGWSQHLLWGAQPTGGALTAPRPSPVNSSLSINPLPLLVSYNTSGSSGTALTIGNLSEYTNIWWRNQWATSAATTYTAFIYEILNMYNKVSLGTGGPCDLILMDQTTYQLFTHAYFSVYKHAPNADDTYPFEAVKFMKATVVMDDKIPDVYTGAPGTEIGGIVDNSTMTYGTAYFLNTKFFKIRYHPARDFEMLKDENGKTFAKPINGDSRLGHASWMGNVTINNRRKQGVLGKIARSLT